MRFDKNRVIGLEKNVYRSWKFCSKNTNSTTWCYSEILLAHVTELPHHRCVQVFSSPTRPQVWVISQSSSPLRPAGHYKVCNTYIQYVYCFPCFLCLLELKMEEIMVWWGYTFTTLSFGGNQIIEVEVNTFWYVESGAFLAVEKVRDKVKFVWGLLFLFSFFEGRLALVGWGGIST